MSRWTINEMIPDQTGRLAVITGANTGLGFETAKALASRGARVVIACRDTTKAQQAVQLIGGDSSYVRLDLASLASIRDTAAELRSRTARIDLLVNNAGVMTSSESQTEDGFELQFGVNHLGHFALTGLLLDLMTRVPGSRVVTVTSPIYARGQYPPRSQFSPQGAYSDAKLANLLFTLELQRRLAAAHAQTISLAAHPGYAKTGLLRHQPAAMQLGSKLAVPLIGQSATMGARPILRAATDPAAHGGQLYAPRWKTKGHPIPTKGATQSPRCERRATTMGRVRTQHKRQLQPDAITRPNLTAPPGTPPTPTGSARAHCHGAQRSGRQSALGAHPAPGATAPARYGRKHHEQTRLPLLSYTA